MRRLGLHSAFILVALAIGTGSAADESDARWWFWGGGLANTRHAADETRLAPHNVARLGVKWSYRADGDISATPTIDGDSLYVPDWGGGLHKLNRHTGALIWKRSVPELTGLNPSFSRNSPAIGASVIVIGDYRSGTILALDKATGNRVWQVLADRDPTTRITSSPVIHEGRVYVGVSTDGEFAIAPAMPGKFRGSVLALDLADGHTVWRFRTVPATYAGGAVWGSTPVVDRGRRSLYVTTGNNIALPEAARACVAAAATDAEESLCLSPANHYDSVLSLDLDTGNLKWARRLTEGADAWIVGCLFGLPTCPAKGSPDLDFGSGVNLITTTIDGQRRQLVGAGQKSGKYWALDPDTGATVWSRQVGPGGLTGGGIQWGSATDGNRVYVAIGNMARKSYFLAGDPLRRWRAGSWAALDARTGQFVWQVPQVETSLLGPASAISPPMTVANGVVYAGAKDGTMVAVDAATGDALWTFRSGGTVMSGPSIVDGTVYWGSGYTSKGGTGSRTLWAFAVP